MSSIREVTEEFFLSLKALIIQIAMDVSAAQQALDEQSIAMQKRSKLYC